MVEFPWFSGFNDDVEGFPPNSGTLLGFQVVAVTPEMDIFSVGNTVFSIALVDLKDPDEPKCRTCGTELWANGGNEEFDCPTCGARVVV